MGEYITPVNFCALVLEALILVPRETEALRNRYGLCLLTVAALIGGKGGQLTHTPHTHPPPKNKILIKYNFCEI